MTGGRIKREEAGLNTSPGRPELPEVSKSDKSSKSDEFSSFYDFRTLFWTLALFLGVLPGFLPELHIYLGIFLIIPPNQTGLNPQK